MAPGEQREEAERAELSRSRNTPVGRTVFDFLAELVNHPRFIPLVAVAAALSGAVLLAAYHATEPGEDVRVFGRPVIKRASQPLPDEPRQLKSLSHVAPARSGLTASAPQSFEEFWKQKQQEAGVDPSP